MAKLSRAAFAALAALAAVPAGIAIAKSAERAGWPTLSPETRARIDDGKLAMARAALRLTPEQEKLWTPVEAAIKDGFKARAEKMVEHRKMRAEFEKDRRDGKLPDFGALVDKMSQNMTERAGYMKAFAVAFKPLYASLSDEQKAVLGPLMHQMGPGFGGPGFGRPGHHGFGPPRSASFGGWGPHGGPDRGGPPPVELEDDGGAPETEGTSPPAGAPK